MKNYVKIARPDHWIKNFFIMPGVAIAFLLTEHSIRDINILKLICAFFATCMIASANYVINEWLDAPFDKFHPTKKNRPVVAENMKFSIVIAEYIALIIVGVILSLLVNKPFLITSLILLFMGFLYNVKPFRTKDIAYFDVLSESINNMLRLMMGWFVVTDSSLPPSSILIGYWMSGAFLMATKRFAEYRMIGNPETAGLYRRSFNYYSEKTLLASALFYSLVSTFCLGVFLIKYRIEYLLCMPLVFLLFSYYVAMAFDPDSAVQRPEKLFKEKTLMFMVFIIIIAFTALTFVNVDFLHSLTSNELIWVRSR
ncbi:UbiA prenyltransferase family protein [Butyrivibrio sp. M55]|uniref:UbiA prenyltransferase family protein n=1 Tax=Butyrivibrio sp. M55 TaxID=1855323 RepID=UPI0008DF4AEC|nr:UbiA prenyltransferase family protein [Butyrivibrio sp. M55]SFU64960.1 4-hydroxybenzoate polyprenyltransferase [Butyrivibrio sp. M55]